MLLAYKKHGSNAVPVRAVTRPNDVSHIVQYFPWSFSVSMQKLMVIYGVFCMTPGIND